MTAKEIAVKKYVVKLSVEERERLESLIRGGKHPARKLTRARILLKADAGEAGEGWSDSHIASALPSTPASRPSPAFVSNWSNAEEGAKSEHMFRKAVRIGGVFANGQHRVVVEDAVEDVAGFARPARNGLGAVDAALVGSVGVELQCLGIIPIHVDDDALGIELNR